MKKILMVLGIAMVLTFMVTMTALAIKPQTIVGYFDAFVPGDPENPTVYCLHTGEVYGVPDGFLTGCVVQPYSDGLGEQGTFTGSIDGKFGTCEYNIRIFDLDGIARFAMNQCTEELAGFHMQGTTASMDYGYWTGNYHFEP